MGLAIIRSRALLGIEAPLVTVEVFLAGGLPTYSLVGLADTAVRESRDRVSGAIESSGLEIPQERIIVNLAPADMRKAGSRFDLPIALGILTASRQVREDCAVRHEFMGELSLNGDLRPVAGVLPAAIAARRAGRPMLIPRDNAAEASLSGAEVYAADTLADVVAHLNGSKPLAVVDDRQPPEAGTAGPDLSDVRGQLLARRALEIAAAGGHNLLFCGPPGTGKSMLARRLPGILPPPSEPEALETAAVRSIAGSEFDFSTMHARPFRCPHHTASAIALVGGGSDPRPGEISLAHNGVLFLDELPEFSRHTLEVLREPLETGRVTISRAGRQADFPARFQLIAAMNPCPCGYLGDPQANCRCSAERVATYRSKVSGPLLDRIDIQVDVPRPLVEFLRPDAAAAESSADVRERVIAAWRRQQERQAGSNALLSGKALHESCEADKAAWDLLDRAMKRFGMSARAHQRLWRVARTIADLETETTVGARHMGEALVLRNAPV